MPGLEFRVLGAVEVWLVAAHPFRESLVAQLMLAQYRAGRPADALATYDVLRRRLREELGADPDRTLRDLHATILSAGIIGGGEPAGAPGRRVRRWRGRRGAGHAARATDRRPAGRQPVRWSYHLLDEPSRLLFARLAVFPGTFSLADAEHACADPGLEVTEVAGILAGLADNSLVHFTGDRG